MLSAYRQIYVPVVELADAPHSKRGTARCAGSMPVRDTKLPLDYGFRKRARTAQRAEAKVRDFGRVA